MSLAARMITPADVKTAKGFVAQLNEMKSREGARRAGSAETARTRDVLHAVVELYYDRFAAAVDVANSATVSGARGFPACEWCCVNGQRAQGDPRALLGRDDRALRAPAARPLPRERSGHDPRRPVRERRRSRATKAQNWIQPPKGPS
jgi:hypothetical protein